MYGIAMTDEEIVQLVQEATDAAGGQRALAREWRISVTWLNMVLNGKAKPRGRILERLGIRRRIIFERDPAAC
jgi:hypothetical protein